MGYVQAAYGTPQFRTAILDRTDNLLTGAGIFASPLVSTQFAQIKHWSFHYLVSLGLTLVDIISLFLIFRGKTQDGVFFWDPLARQCS
jgi:hypothetical protein